MPVPISVSDVMSRPVVTGSPDTTAKEAARRCAAEGVGSLVVVEDGEPVGIVTDTDLVDLLGNGTDPRTRPVREFMSTPVLTVDVDARVGNAVEKMVEADVSRLVVVDEGEMVGLVSSDDITRYVPQILHRRQFESPPQEPSHQFRVHQATAYEQPDWEFEGKSVSDATVTVGDAIAFSKTISEQDVRSFAAASGDTNRLHLDAEYAAETRFGRRIVHGTLVGGLISAALARLPGLTIYLSQDLSFLRPVDVGDRVTAVCEVVDRIDGNKFELTTDVFDGEGKQVIEGQAAVLIDEAPASAEVEVSPLPGQ